MMEKEARSMDAGRSEKDQRRYCGWEDESTEAGCKQCSLLRRRGGSCVCVCVCVWRPERNFGRSMSFPRCFACGIDLVVLKKRLNGCSKGAKSKGKK